MWFGSESRHGTSYELLCHLPPSAALPFTFSDHNRSTSSTAEVHYSQLFVSVVSFNEPSTSLLAKSCLFTHLADRMSDISIDFESFLSS